MHKLLRAHSSASATAGRPVQQAWRAGGGAVDTTWGKDCKSWLSCVDWYGNARPLFVGGRVFALLGYELVEGVFKEGRIQELRRMDFGRPLRLLR
jgi:hypothetical protein